MCKKGYAVGFEVNSQILDCKINRQKTFFILTNCQSTCLRIASFEQQVSAGVKNSAIWSRLFPECQKNGRKIVFLLCKVCVAEIFGSIG